MPNEIEWEYAARGGTEKKYGVPAPGGSDDIAGKGLANCRGCGSERDWESTVPVGGFKANPFGLYDMSGNVMEWVEEWVQDRYGFYPKRLTGAEAGEDFYVLRGGAWGNDPDYVRSSMRTGVFNMFSRGDDIGFRVLCSSLIHE